MTTPTEAKNDSGPSSEERVEKTFRLLQNAKKLESESNYWLATERFVEAHQLLKVLAEEENKKTVAVAVDGATSDETAAIGETEDTKQIAQLYASKADEYWKQSRHCLIQAMEQEKIHDEQEQEQKQQQHLLNDDQARARNNSFAVLFSRSPIVVVADGRGSTQQLLPHIPASTNDNDIDNDDTDTDNHHIEDHDDLEARLTALNQSLPSGFKTTDERMSEVNKGLNKLGLSLYTQKQPFARFEDEVPKSEDEQIDDIIAQANDEATIDRLNRNSKFGRDENDQNDNGTRNQLAGSSNNKEEDNDEDDFFSDDDDDDDDSDNSEEDELLGDDQLAMKTIQKKVVKARIKLVELLALLDQARSKRAQDEIDEEEAIFKNDCDTSDEEDDDNGDVQQHDVAFLMMTGKRKLKSAQRDMRKALIEWDDLVSLLS